MVGKIKHIEVKGTRVTVTMDTLESAQAMGTIMEGFKVMMDGVYRGAVEGLLPTPPQPEPPAPLAPERPTTPADQEEVVEPPQQFSMEEKSTAAKEMGAAYEALGIGRSDEHTLLRVSWALFITGKADKTEIFSSVPLMRSVTLSLRRLHDEVPKQFHKEIPAAMQESMEQHMGLNLIIEGFQLKAKEKEVKKQTKK